MLFHGQISFHPQQESLIAKKPPSGLFGRFFNVITAGALSKTEEQQTFTALEILQDFNRVFRNMGLTNVISLAKDGFNYYTDNHHKEHDLDEALRAFKLQNDSLTSELFNDLFLTLEHRQGAFDYLIELDIKRVHLVGQAPIVVNVYGLLNQFKRRANEDNEALQKRMQQSLKSTHYSTLTQSFQLEFNAFVSELELNVYKSLRVKPAIKTQRAQVIRPEVANTARPNNQTNAIPVFSDRYRTSSESYTYCFLWMACMHSNAIEASQFELIDEQGMLLLDVDDEQINASELAVFDPNIETTELTRSNIDVSTTSSETFHHAELESSSSWLSDLSSDSSSDSGSSGSSCGSSCGSGCGSS